MKKSQLLLTALMVLMGLNAALALEPRMVFEKYIWAEGVDPKARYLDQLMVKFYDEDMVRLRDGRFVSTNGRAALTYTNDFLSRHPGVRPDVIIRSETEEEHLARLTDLEQKCGKDLVDMFSFYCFHLPQADADPKALLADILGAPEVETAYYEPIPIDFTCQDLGDPTPSWFNSQNHYDAAPLGVDLHYVRATFGVELSDGVESTWVGIFERGADTGHEDYTTISIPTGGSGDADNDHGTAVSGIMGACDENNVGMIGFVADHEIRVYQRNSPNYASTADVYNFANIQLIAGEVTTNSWGYTCNPCPPGQSCPCNPDQNGSVPIEWNAAVKAEVDQGTAEGIIYCLSAGNGCVNLDWIGFGSIFDWTTGSIYVGAVTSVGDHDANCFTDWGSRVTSCAWGDGVYTLGYGGLFMGSGVDEEWYTAGFNGTSAAGPIVAGCAAVLNNLYRDQNGGANISPTTMRSWLTINGTPPGNVTPGNLGVMPNLFGITAPELNPDIRTGWYTYIVPRNTNDADGSSAPLPGNLNSSPSATYWNWSAENESHFGTATPFRFALYRDDVFFVSCFYASAGPEFRGWCEDYQSNTRGGRHTVRITVDQDEEVAEVNENNNDYVRQYVWDPRELSANVVLGFTSPPLDIVTGQLPGWPSENNDGYGGSNFASDGWWDIVAVMSESGADYDAYAYSEAITSTNGFDDWEELSFFGGGTMDFVGVNNNEVVGGNGVSLLAAVNNFADGTDDYRVEGGTSTNLGAVGIGRTSTGAQVLSSTELFDNWEIYVGELVPYNIEVDVTAGNANVVITVFGPSNVYFGRDDEVIQRNAAGAGGDEMISCWTPPEIGWYGIIVHKNSSSDWNESANFTMYVGKAGFDLTHNLNAGWSHEIVIQQVNGTPPFVLPASLPGNVGTNRINAGYINQGCETSPLGLNDRFYLDGPAVFTTGSWAPHGPGTTTYWSNQGPIFVFGGRHNIGDSIDVFQEGAEWLEDNNRHDEQFVWTPFVMTNQTPNLTSGTAPNWRNFESSELFAAANQDGWRFTGSYWSGVGMVSVDPDDDYNLHIYSPTAGSEDGFETSLAPSYTPPGMVDFVLENGNVNGFGATQDVGVTNNWAWPGTPSEGAYRTYQCNRIEDLVVDDVNGPYTLSLNHLIHVFDIFLDNGVTERFILDNMGAVDLGLAIFPAGLDYGSRTTGGTIINSNGDGGDESVMYTPTVSGYHGVVVFKNDNTDLASTNYRLIIGDRTPAAPLGLVLRVVDNTVNPIQMLAHWDSVTTDMNGNPMNVDQYQLFYVLGTVEPPFPGGWTPYLTTPLATINFGVGLGVEQFRMVVVAQDSDGLILAHSPLPDGIDITGMRLDAGMSVERGGWVIGGGDAGPPLRTQE